MQGTGAAARLREMLPGTVMEIREEIDQAVVFVPPALIVEACRLLHDDPELGFTYLSDLTALDLGSGEPRFNVVYNLYSMRKNDWLRIKTPIASVNPSVPSVIGVWRGANWLEREVYDMFGIAFEGHPDLKRILMPDEWDGRPLRKDYPLKGLEDETVMLFQDVRDVLGDRGEIQD